LISKRSNVLNTLVCFLWEFRSYSAVTKLRFDRGKSRLYSALCHWVSSVRWIGNYCRPDYHIWS